MSTEENKELVRRFYHELWNRWRFALIDELLAPDLRFRGSLGTTTWGREEFARYVAAVRAAFPDFHNQIEELIAEEDNVVARLTYRGTHRGELFGLPPAGREIVYAGVAIFRIGGEQIAEGWVLGDVWGLRRQIEGKDDVADLPPAD